MGVVANVEMTLGDSRCDQCWGHRVWPLGLVGVINGCNHWVGPVDVV